MLTAQMNFLSLVNSKQQTANSEWPVLAAGYRGFEQSCRKFCAAADLYVGRKR